MIISMNSQHDYAASAAPLDKMVVANALLGFGLYGLFLVLAGGLLIALGAGLLSVLWPMLKGLLLLFV